MSYWGNKADRSQMPKWLSKEEKNRTILTNRGWEMQPHGNDNPASSEVIVALGGSVQEGVVNDAPTYSEELYSRGYNIIGISGAAIIPVRFEVYDLESVNEQMQLTVDGSFPAGLTVGVGSSSDHEFIITGTPTATSSDSTFIVFMDGGTSGASVGVGLTVGITFGVNITE